ncbi:TRAP transporter large permease [Celeribacter litoreus]|uniref:TRAP transporter large permease n=1 Tax=Celeribacter litoreus TaxID=2876714 RepID=UPI001CCEE9AF|nr:TRAP transporter large permease [Celeribacter litoreus]MCA0044832.1 TRAP transporter large permease [Celeribacter litoreus]
MLEPLIATALLLMLAVFRVPIAIAMIVVGSVGFALLRGTSASLTMLSTTAFDTVFSYSLSVIPLFIFMGNLLAHSGVASGLFSATQRLVRKMPGGLAMAAVLSCGGFSAVSGSSLATAATMSKVAMPSLRKFGYSDSLSSGAIAAGGTLGILIPPSVILIIYGILTESDIGLLFLAGIIPGLIGLLGYVLAVWAAVLVNPSLAPKEYDVDDHPVEGLYGVILSIALFAFIMIGIYGGFFTPIEAAGMGAGMALLMVVVTGHAKLPEIWQSLMETAESTAMIFLVVIGAEVFSNYINLAGLPDELAGFVDGLDVNAWVVMAMIIAIYLVLGTVLESLSMILLTVPIFYPLMYQLDFGLDILYDPEYALIWFGIIVVVVTEVSLITPPVGMNVFVLKATLPDVSLKTIFKGILPFWISDILRLILLIAFPTISLWLVAG